MRIDACIGCHVGLVPIIRYVVPRVAQMLARRHWDCQVCAPRALCLLWHWGCAASVLGLVLFAVLDHPGAPPNAGGAALVEMCQLMNCANSAANDLSAFQKRDSGGNRTSS